jgi:hypothetical protein
MIYKKLTKLISEDVQIYAKIDDDGKCRLTCTEDNEEFIQWKEDGGTVIDNGGGE